MEGNPKIMQERPTNIPLERMDDGGVVTIFNNDEQAMDEHETNKVLIAYFAVVILPSLTVIW